MCHIIKKSCSVLGCFCRPWNGILLEFFGKKDCSFALLPQTNVSTLTMTLVYGGVLLIPQCTCTEDGRSHSSPYIGQFQFRNLNAVMIRVVCIVQTAIYSNAPPQPKKLGSEGLQSHNHTVCTVASSPPHSLWRLFSNNCNIIHNRRN